MRCRYNLEIKMLILLLNYFKKLLIKLLKCYEVVLIEKIFIRTRTAQNVN